MKKAALLALAFLVSIPLGLAAQSDASSDGYYAPSFARLTYVQGDVFVQRTSDLGTERGEVNLVLVQGDKLGTGAGQAEVNFGRRNYLRLAENSKVEFAVLPTGGDNHVKIHVLEGSAYLRVGTLSGEKAFEVHTPDVSCYILDEGLYRLNVVPDGQTEVLVTEGSLEAAGEEGSVVVRAGESVTAANGRLLGEPAYAAAPSDAFARWNASRDALFAQRSPSRYLPSQIDEYEEELDQNGHWTYEQPYGYVWIPYVVDAGWRPYYYGRWSWYPLIGWTWISSEPWGWSVYHYGRWHWQFGLGWYWIPHWSFGPAWVNWWWDNDYIGWCPLSWYNRPVVVVGNSFYDRFRSPYFPRDNRAMTVIHRDRLQAPDVARHSVRGDELSRIDHISLRAEQPGIRPAVGRSSLQSPEAQRIFSARPGIRNEAKSYAPGRSLSDSRLRQGGSAWSARTTYGTGSARGSGQERSIRVYPSHPDSSSPRQGQTGRISPSRSDSGRVVERPGGQGSASAGSETRSGERVRHYPSSTGRETSGLSARSSSSAGEFRPDPSLYARTYPSRLGQGTASGSRSYNPAPRYDPRTYSYSRPSSPSYSGSRSYSSYSAPSRSSGFSGRSSSAPRYSAPSRGGYSSSSRSGHSTPSRSSSTSHSSFSSGHSNVRRRG